ncbi:Crp/Fnr family transcriptional regulator [Pedobacter riviphilus]|uniref:Crp/Fnr family transcriptional regulator n=1 Tax=Pedobacter riviphilus TaxID=2766984 RepID=A0ABX6TKE8_9SPHI|nr:Crp/Fnr family transcriptional regulator [Pedobacter riviphilus]QNR85044.1 Crp/Fnr family transcriptional regulator [Pedobacter riviphilus]
MELIKYLNTATKLSPGEAEHVDRSFSKKEYAKNVLLERPENFSKQVYFIEKGLVRAFYYKEEKDITHMFFDEDSFLVAFESIFFNRAHPYGLEIVEPSNVRTISYAQLDVLCNTIPAFKDHKLLVALKMISRLSEKIYSLQFHSADQRYKDLLHTTPNILLRAPLGHIASYLGITQQTLSVIRAGK